MLTIWTSDSQINAGIAGYLASRTALGTDRIRVQHVHYAHSRKFGRNPSWLRTIASLAPPPVLVTQDDGGFDRPILAFLYTRHAAMGQNPFQNFTQAVASVEAGFPLIWVQPIRSYIHRKTGRPTIEQVSSVFWRALLRLGEINQTPALLVPWEYVNGDPKLPLEEDPDWPRFPNCEKCPPLRELVDTFWLHGVHSPPLTLLESRCVRRLAQDMAHSSAYSAEPMSYRSGRLLHFDKLHTLLNDIGLGQEERATVLQSLTPDKEALVVQTDTKTLRADPYAGTVAAYDYAFCRHGRRTSERGRHLVLHFRRVPFLTAWQRLTKTKTRENRLFFGTADLVIFEDGVFFQSPQGWTAFSTKLSSTYIDDYLKLIGLHVDE